MIDIENKIRNVNKNALLKGLKLHMGSFNFEFNDIGLPYVNFTDALFEHTDCRFSIDEGIYTNPEDILEQIIGYYKVLEQQRQKMLELGFEPVGLSKTLFYFKLTVGETEHFFYRKTLLSGYGAFLGNAVYHEKMENDKMTTNYVARSSEDMISCVMSVFRKLPLDKQILLPSGIRDMLI